MKRLMVWVVLLAMVFCTVGCAQLTDPDPQSLLGAYKEDEERQVIPARHYISLVFYEDMDTNPLTTNNSENHELLKLVYSPLIRLNSTLTPDYILAESVTQEGATVTAVLKKGLKFSDGTPITAADAVASYQTVKKTPTSPYYSRLAQTTSITAADERTVVFRLKAPDVDFINGLDIPIMPRQGNGASGPYRFSHKNGKLVLVPNTNHYVQPGLATIYLQKPANEKQRQEMFAVGLLDVYFTTAEGELVFSGGKDYQVQTYAGDHLLFVGVNGNDPLMASAPFRHFVSGLIERQKLADTVLLGQAEATAYPFQPAWYKAQGLQHEKNLSDIDKKEQAAALGMNLTETALYDAAGQQIALSLLVAEGSSVQADTARAVADSLALSGIKVVIESVPRAIYDARLQAGSYQLYLGEAKTGRTLNPGLYTPGSGICFGGVSYPALEQAAAQYKEGAISLGEFAAVFDQVTPIMPLAYRRGVLFVAKDIGTFQSTGAWSLYGDITKLITKETELTK